MQLVWKTEMDHGLNFLRLQLIVVLKQDPDLGLLSQRLSLLIGEMGLLTHPAQGRREGWLKLRPGHRLPLAHSRRLTSGS